MNKEIFSSKTKIQGTNHSSSLGNERWIVLICQRARKKTETERQRQRERKTERQRDKYRVTERKRDRNTE